MTLQRELNKGTRGLWLWDKWDKEKGEPSVAFRRRSSCWHCYIEINANSAARRDSSCSAGFVKAKQDGEAAEMLSSISGANSIQTRE